MFDCIRGGGYYLRDRGAIGSAQEDNCVVEVDKTSPPFGYNIVKGFSAENNIEKYKKNERHLYLSKISDII